MNLFIFISSKAT